MFENCVRKSIEFPVPTKHHCDMTEKLLKVMINLNNIHNTHLKFHEQEYELLCDKHKDLGSAPSKDSDTGCKVE